MTNSWTQAGPFNVTLKGEGFFVSFNEGLNETALVVKRNGERKTLVLNGDFRELFELLVPKGLEACLAAFHRNEEFKSKWSEG